MVCREAKLVKRRSIAEVAGSSPATATNIQAWTRTSTLRFLLINY